MKNMFQLMSIGHRTQSKMRVSLNIFHGIRKNKVPNPLNWNAFSLLVITHKNLLHLSPNRKKEKSFFRRDLNVCVFFLVWTNHFMNERTLIIISRPKIAFKFNNPRRDHEECSSINKVLFWCFFLCWINYRIILIFSQFGFRNETTTKRRASLNSSKIMIIIEKRQNCWQYWIRHSNKSELIFVTRNATGCICVNWLL